MPISSLRVEGDVIRWASGFATKFQERQKEKEAPFDASEFHFETDLLNPLGQGIQRSRYFRICGDGGAIQQ